MARVLFDVPRVGPERSIDGLSELPQVDRREVSNVAEAPDRMEYCSESLFGSRKADLITRLHDQRVMPIECKVSSSSTNSIKRLNNDAAVKARIWIDEFGTLSVIPTAVLSGVFKLRNLKTAQDAGLMIVWAHDLAALTTFIEATKP